ncbi:MAG: hypothetical protein AAGH41_10380 [Pseudomonadota bacterium]
MNVRSAVFGILAVLVTASCTERPTVFDAEAAYFQSPDSFRALEALIASAPEGNFRSPANFDNQRLAALDRSFEALQAKVSSVDLVLFQKVEGTDRIMVDIDSAEFGGTQTYVALHFARGRPTMSASTQASEVFDQCDYRISNFLKAHTDEWVEAWCRIQGNWYAFVFQY